MGTHFYRPQRSCGQGNIFTPVCHSVHRAGVCLSACWDTLPWEADSSVRSMSGRYASYWNAFLCLLCTRFFFVMHQRITIFWWHITKNIKCFGVQQEFLAHDKKTGTHNLQSSLKPETRTTVISGLIFSQVCVSHSVHGTCIFW